MCGIAGYKTDRRIDRQVIADMVNELVHRGPDSAGYYSSGPYTAGMRRLKINDIEGGDQPLYNEKKNIVLFYNGEIYNSPQLRERLEKQGHSFRSRCDGEVICHLYEDVGEKVFEELDGMFAIALWDEIHRKLLLARDIPGEKPLYYSCLGKNEVAFSSEIKGLIRFPDIDLNLNRQAIWDFPTFLWIPEPQTAYESIKALPRSHFMIIDDSGITLRYFENKFNQQSVDSTDASIISETRRVIESAVESRLLSDVPVGCFLSGGLDSSIVATLASRSLPELSTFCIAFEDVADPYHGRADESIYAAQLAGKLGSRHHTIRVSSEDFRNQLPIFCTSGDQPFAVSSGLGILTVAKAAHREGVKVLLSGDGADECFGGYSWYAYLQNSARPCCVSPSTKSGNGVVSFQSVGLPLEQRLAVLRAYPAPKRAWAWHYYASEEDKSSLYNAEYFYNILSSHRFFSEFKPDDEWTPEHFIRQDRQFYFPFEMLRKLDRMTMAYSVEGRVPFAAPSVLAHSEKLQYHHMVRDGVLKWALRKAFSDMLPDEVVARPKHGFNVPIDHWLKGEWADLVEESFGASSALMRTGIIHSKSRTAAQRMIRENERLNGHTIFCLIMLNFWLEQTIYGTHCGDWSKS